MLIIKEIRHLIFKEVVLELRQKYVLNGILLYVISTIFVCYLAFKHVDATTWIAVFWIIILFASVNAIAKSFIQDSKGKSLYYYTLADPKSVILAKMIYNILLMLILSFICIVFYCVVMGNPVKDFLTYAIAILLGSIGFSTSFTMISAIASKTSNNISLMTILSFPIIIPILIMLIRLSNRAITGIGIPNNYDEIIVLIAINIIIVTVSFILFPYLWRE